MAATRSAPEAAAAPAVLPRQSLPPGPRAPAALQTARLIARPVEYFESCRRRYGEPFTGRVLGTGTMVFISDPPSLKRLFAADRRNRLPAGRHLVLRPLLGPRSLLLLEGEEHLRRRRLMLPPFHGERMRAYESVMVKATERELERWPQGTPFPLHPGMQSITLDVILHAVFGVGRGPRHDALRTRLVQLLALTRGPRVVGFTVPALRWLPAYRGAGRMIAEADGLLAEEIAERRADPELGRREDILSLLVGARDEAGEGMDDEELRDQLMTLLLAGHETTATALAWAFELLFRNPAPMRRLREEVESGEDGYVDAVAAETLRLRPVVPFVGRLLSEPMELAGYELPAGIAAMPAIYLTHTRPDLYPEPYAFKPERFENGGPETYSWIPFGGGTRRCLGGAFAQFEMRVVLRTLLERVELQPASTQPEPAIRRNVTLAPKSGTPAILVSRARA